MGGSEVLVITDTWTTTHGGFMVNAEHELCSALQHSDYKDPPLVIYELKEESDGGGV